MEAKGHPEAGVVREAAEAVKAPVEVKPEVAKVRVQDSEIKNASVAEGRNPALSTQPTVTAEKIALVETPVAERQDSAFAPKPTKSPRKSPTKSALAKEMEAMGLDFAKPEDYATYRIMKLIEGGKPLPQEKVAKKAKAKTDTVDKEAEARLAEDLAREESKARKRVEEEKARDEQPEVEPEGEEVKSGQGPHLAETTRDSKGKPADEDRSAKSDTPKKTTPKVKKSTPSTPEQAAKEALWKFQAAHIPDRGEKKHSG